MKKKCMQIIFYIFKIGNKLKDRIIHNQMFYLDKNFNITIAEDIKEKENYEIIKLK